MFGGVVYIDVHLCIKTATTLFDLKNFKMLVREYNSTIWKYISRSEWEAAEDKAGKNSAFASSRCPNSIVGSAWDWAGICQLIKNTPNNLKNFKMLTIMQAYHLPKEWEKSGKDILAEFKTIAENVEQSLATLERDCEFLSDGDHLIGGEHYYVHLERHRAIFWANENLKLLEKRVREILFPKEIQVC